MEPLAHKIRPTSLNEFVGQEHLVGEGKPLRMAMQNRHLFSFVLWGPPGVGKTTLAKIYAKEMDAKLYELSAVSAGKEDIKKIISNDKFQISNHDLSAPPEAGHLPKPGENNIVESSPKILFLDEIHRFNKAQQDFLLPFVERGELYLIGATTENPSFEVIPALLSRCRVFVLNELSDEEIAEIINRANIKMDNEAKAWLIQMSNGDARQALAMIENCQKLYGAITLENLKQTLQSKYLRYDKAGEEHYNTISAFIKSMRASQPDAALYYLARMVEAGEDPLFIARRMVVFASEDIGLAQPTALVVANSVFRACETIGYPECAINLAHGVAYLSNCKKDRSAYDAYFAALDDVKQHGNLPVPMNIRNAPTKLMKELGYGKGYEKYPDQNNNDDNNNNYLPEKLKGKKYLI